MNPPPKNQESTEALKKSTIPAIKNGVKCVRVFSQRSALLSSILSFSEACL